MFVRVKKIGAYEYLYLVENAREGGRHVQRVIKALGRRDEVEASGLIDGLIASAARHSRRSIVLSSFYRGDLPELHRLSIGPDLVFGRLWAETGCRDVLKASLPTGAFPLMSSARSTSPCCTGSSYRAPTAMPMTGAAGCACLVLKGSISTTPIRRWPGLARSTPRVAAPLRRSKRRSIASASRCSAPSRSHFSTPRHCGSKVPAARSLGQRGHSKDYRGHLKQVVLGIVLDDADRPIASFLMPGNTADVTLLLPVVKRLRERFGIQEACIVADRGMISADTMAVLEAEKIQYILGVRERTSREVRTEIIEDDGLTVPLLIPRQKGETELAIRETTIAGRRYVICRNEEEAKKDAAARAELVAGLKRKLAQGDKALVANKGFRRFLKTPQGDGFVIDRAKVEADARFDGLFVLRTNTKIAALQVVLRYRNLLAVEDAFKTAKALLATRPIFHKTDAGIRGHVFCTFLALVLRKELFDRLAARHSRLEWQRIVDDLADLSEIEIEQDGRRALLRTAPGPTIDPICRAIGLTLPPVFQEVPPAA